MRPAPSRVMIGGRLGRESDPRSDPLREDVMRNVLLAVCAAVGVASSGAAAPAARRRGPGRRRAGRQGPRRLRPPLPPPRRPRHDAGRPDRHGPRDAVPDRDDRAASQPAPQRHPPAGRPRDRLRQHRQRRQDVLHARRPAAEGERRAGGRAARNDAAQPGRPPRAAADRQGLRPGGVGEVAVNDRLALGVKAKAPGRATCGCSSTRRRASWSRRNTPSTTAPARRSCRRRCTATSGTWRASSGR